MQESGKKRKRGFKGDGKRGATRRGRNRHRYRSNQKKVRLNQSEKEANRFIPGSNKDLKSGGQGNGLITMGQGPFESERFGWREREGPTQARMRGEHTHRDRSRRLEEALLCDGLNAHVSFLPRRIAGKTKGSLAKDSTLQQRRDRRTRLRGEKQHKQGGNQEKSSKLWKRRG